MEHITVTFVVTDDLKNLKEIIVDPAETPLKYLDKLLTAAAKGFRQEYE